EITLNVVLAGASAVVDWERERVREIVPRVDEGATIPDEDAWPHLHVTLFPSALRARLSALTSIVREHELTARLVVDPLIATVDVHLRPDHIDTEVVAAIVRELRAAGDAVAVRRGATATMEALDPFGDPSPALEWMK